MELSTIEMPKAVAQERYREWRRSIAEKQLETDRELDDILCGYKALARGDRLISLSQTILAGGVGEDGLPRMAVCVADEKWCMVTYRPQGEATFTGYKVPGWGRGTDQNHRAPTRRVRVEGLPTFDDTWSRGSGQRAMVPIVPPPLRPRHKLSGYHVLWEAIWEKNPTPPGDPALLKRISGDLFAVLAVWDLSLVERAVLSGRT